MKVLKGKITVLLVLICISFTLQAQIREGHQFIVVDSASGKALPFATILGEKPSFMTSTDIRGYFTADFEEHKELKITLSHVGYKTITIALKKGHPKIIKLSPFVEMLNEVEVKSHVVTKEEAKEAKKIVEAALKQLKKTSEAFVAEGDYKHRILENGKYVKIKDGRILYKDDEGYGKIYKNPSEPNEEIHFQHLRNSLDFAEHEMVFFVSNYNFYVDEFNFLLNNGLKYQSSKWQDEIFYIKESKIIDNEIINYTVSVDLGYKRSDSLFGDLTVIADLTFDISYDKNEGSFLINSFEKNYISKRLKGGITHGENNFFKIDLGKKKNKIIPVQVSHLLYQNIVLGTDTVTIEAVHQINFDQWDFDKNSIPRNDIRHNTIYNKKYWAQYPLSQKELSDLGGMNQLEEQFQSQNKSQVFAAMQEQLKVDLIKKSLQNRTNQSSYFVFWKTPSDIMQYFTKAAYLIPFTTVTPIFIYAGDQMNEKAWRSTCWTTDLMYLPNFYLPNSYGQLLDSGEVTPLFKLVKSNEILTTKEPLDFKTLQK